MNNKIAITIQNYVQFYSIKPFIDLSDTYDIDIFVPTDNDGTGFNNMFDDVYNFLVKEGYNVYRKVDTSIKYKILLEPYPMDYYLKFNYVYRIKYKYSVISAKPKLIYKLSSNIFYDAIICHSTYEEELLSIFSKTYLVGKLNYINFRRKNGKFKKKTLLYLPTYGYLNSIDDVLEQLKYLGKKYNIITKEHHGTNYLHSENEKSKKLNKYINKFYDSSYPLNKLLEIADVVLSDNSGSIFEALYSEVPVCIFSKNMDDCSLGKLHSLQYSLAEQNIIPCTEDVNALDDIIELALTEEVYNKQKEISKKLFPLNKDDILSSFTHVIDLYLSDNINFDSFLLHRELEKEYLNFNENLDNLKQELIKKENLYSSELEILNKQINDLNLENVQMLKVLNEYKNGKLYKVATKIYSFKSKMRRSKNEK